DVDANGCWLSQYSTASHGYSQVGWQDAGSRHVVLGHRAAWVHVHGQVPAGVTLDHICKVRRCVNPGHLRVLSNFENARRTNGRDWRVGFCVNGHPNSMLREISSVSKGRRRVRLICAECKRVYAQRSNWRQRRGDEPLPERLFLESDLA